MRLCCEILFMVLVVGCLAESTNNPSAISTSPTTQPISTARAPCGKAFALTSESLLNLDRYKRIPRALQQEKKHRQLWESYTYIPLAQVEEQVERVIQKSLAGKLSDTKMRKLQKTLWEFFYALGANSPSEYLERIPGRALPAALDWKNIPLNINLYYLTGDTEPWKALKRAKPLEVFELFWQGRRECPISVSLGTDEGIAVNICTTIGGEPQYQTRPGKNWETAYSTSFVLLTLPRKTEGELLNNRRKTTTVSIDTVLCTKDNHLVPICLTFLWDTANEAWALVYCCSQTDEKVLWPL